MQKKELAVKVTELLFEFNAQERGENVSFKDFVGFLNAHLQKYPTISEIRQIDGTQEEWVTRETSRSSDVSVLLSFLARYLKAYTKKALIDSDISTAEEFGFIITLFRYKSLTKTELINKQAVERTSGVEIIKRLIKMEFVNESQDPTDGRSIRLSINQKGREVIKDILPKMMEVSELVRGNLDEAELNTLAYLLKKLDDFHFSIFSNQNQKKKTFDEILRNQANYSN